MIPQLIQALPLILSDSQDPKDISETRVIAALFAVALLVSLPIVFLWLPQYITEFKGYWSDALLFLGSLLGANVIKKFTPIKQGG